MRSLHFIFAALLILLSAGCAQNPILDKLPFSGQAGAEAQARLQQGLQHYRDNRYDAALADLDAALDSGRLKRADEINARKHLAFLYCASNREAQCREQFQAVLKIDADFDLAPNEASHPNWGPVWKSIKAAADDQRAVSRGSGFLAPPAMQNLAEGIKEYEAGNFLHSAVLMQEALKFGFKEQPDELRARKYLAFVYCLTGSMAACRNEFRSIFALDPSFELVPSEAGHPAWSAIYRKERALAKRKAAGKLFSSNK